MARKKQTLYSVLPWAWFSGTGTSFLYLNFITSQNQGQIPTKLVSPFWAFSNDIFWLLREVAYMSRLGKNIFIIIRKDGKKSI